QVARDIERNRSPLNPNNRARDPSTRCARSGWLSCRIVSLKRSACWLHHREKPAGALLAATVATAKVRCGRRECSEGVVGPFVTVEPMERKTPMKTLSLFGLLLVFPGSLFAQDRAHDLASRAG